MFKDLIKHTPTEFALKNGIYDEDTEALAKIKLNECYEDIMSLIKEYMDMPEDQIRLVAVWIIGTYFHDCFSTYPFLFINAMRGSGKTRLLRIISNLSKNSNGQVQTGITESVLFRTGEGVTLVLDECESIGSKEKAILREYLNACYKKGGVVKRVKKAKLMGQDEFVIDTFKPYKPIAMANIWGMDEVLQDRCITFILEKSNNPAKTKKVEDFEENEIINVIKRTLREVSVVYAMSLRKRNYRKAWNEYISEYYNDITTYTSLRTQNNINNINNNNNNIFNNINNINNIFNKINELNIDGRNFELLFPFFIITNILNEDEFNIMLRIGKEIISLKKEDEFVESRDVLLYEFVSRQEPTVNYIPLKQFTYNFKTFVGEDDWINEKWVGRALKRLNLILNKRREASGRLIILDIAKARTKIRIFGKGEDEI